MTLFTAEALQQAFYAAQRDFISCLGLIKECNRVFFLTFSGRQDFLYVAEPVFECLFREGPWAPAKLGLGPERNKHAKTGEAT